VEEQEPRVILGVMASLAPLVNEVSTDLMGELVQQDHLVLRVEMDELDLQEVLVLLDLVDVMDPMAGLVLLV
jgi:hypothetical protein